MNLTNIDSINTVISNYDMYNNRPQGKTNETHSMDLITNDYVDFSIDYANGGVSSILDSIKESFDANDCMSNNESLLDYTNKYGQILKNINSDPKIDNDTRSQLTKILDNSFDHFSEKKVKEFGSNISNFFNRAYNMKKSYDAQGTNMGIKGDKILNEEDVEKNIKNMFSAAKNFYKNNLNGTKEELDMFLQNKFSKTESVEKLSYSDFKSLQKALDIVNDKDKIPKDVSIYGYIRRQSEAMNNALENLKKEGASSIVTNAFEKAINQNNNSNKRIETYAGIRSGYQKRLDDLFTESLKNELELKELKKKREKMIEEYNKNMEKLQHDMYKLNMFNLTTNKSGETYNPIENLTKQHNKQLEILDKQQTQITDRLSTIKKVFKETSENYDEFMKNPASAIDSYLKETSNKEAE